MNSDDHNPAGLQFVDAAFEIGNALDSGRDEILTAVADKYAAMCLLDDAIKAAEELSDSYLRGTAIAQVAVKIVACEPEADVLSLLDEIEDPGIHNLALEQIAIKYAESGLFEEALDITARLETSDATLSRIVTLIAEKDSLERGEELTAEINDSGARTTSLIDLATIAKDADRRVEAENLLLKAEAETKLEESPEERVYHAMAVADVYEALDQKEKAQETLLLAFKLCGEIEGSPHDDLGKSFSRDEALVDVAGRFARRGDFDQADLALQQIEHPFEFARAVTQQAIEHHKVEHLTQALELLTQADDLITSQECYGPVELELRDVAIAELAVGYAICGHYNKALPKALLVLDLKQQVRTLIELGRKAALADLSDSIFEIYGALSGDYPRASYLVEVSDSLRKLDKAERAVKLLMTAIEDAEKIERPDEKCLMLLKISSRLIESDLEPKANEILATVLHTVSGLNDGYKRARVVLALADHYHEHPRELGSQEEEMLEKVVM